MARFLNTTFLGVALLAIGTVATLSAFTGETSKKGSKPFLQRVTQRGWISLFCLLLTLVLGTAKEIATSKEDAKKEQAAKDAKQISDQRETLAEDAVRAAKKDAEEARKSLADLHKIDQLTQDRLEDAKTTLNDVHGTLNATREYLDESSASSLIATLANEGVTVSDVMIALPLTEAAKKSARFRDALLPSFNNRECTDITGLTVSILTNAKSVVTIYYPPGDDATTHDYLSDPTKKKDEIVDTVESGKQGIVDLNSFTGQNSANGILYTAIFHLAGQSISAAQLYSVLAKPNAEVFGVASTWPTVFSTRMTLNQAETAYPEIYKGSGNLAHLNQGVNDGIDSKTAAPYPSECSVRVREYFSHAFDKATLFLFLEQKQNEMISVRLNAESPKQNKGMWYVPFVATGAPRVQAFGEATKGLMNGMKWTP
jgi:preprotein translocase subunit SecG